MQKRSNFFPIFFLFLLISIIILGLSIFGKLAEPQSFIEKGISLLPKTFFGFFQGLPFVSESKQIKKLKDENLSLANKLVDQEKLKKENVALLSQFQTREPKSYNLLPAKIVGAPGFIPGVTPPSTLILDKGAKDNVGVGDSVVLKNNLIGKIVKTSSYLAKVDLVTHTSSSFTAKTLNGALGVIRGSGGDRMTLDNVLPSQNLKIDDLILTKGDVNMDGSGIPPDIIVGKIESIEKIPVAIFQKAEVKSLVDFTKLSAVFVVMQTD